MSTDDRLQVYLAAASAGLEGDREVQLEVRAELASHVDDAARAFRAAGLPGGQAADQALKSMGPATDIAAELAAANRRRLAWRARARLAILALLVPAAVVSAVYVYIRETGLWTRKGVPPDDAIADSAPALEGRFADDGIRLLNVLSPRRALRLTDKQDLILHGDRSRPEGPARWRAAWEAHPDNPVYLNDYITRLTAGYTDLGGTEKGRLSAYERELEKARAAEPGNARFDYLLAGQLLKRAADLDVAGPGATNRAESLTIEIRDPAAYERAMAAFRAAQDKPYFRRYTQDMFRERMAILGEPDSLRKQMDLIALAAGVLIPDAGLFRNLARAACLEAERHVEAGRPADARRLQEGCLQMAVRLHADAFCLVDVLVANGLAGIYSHCAPGLYERMGDPAAAEAARRKAAALSGPVSEWRAAMRRPDKPMEDRLRRQGSMLSGLLMPNLGEPVSDADLRPSRLLEYVLIERVTVEAMLFALLGLLAAALGIWVRWRWIRGGASAPLLLLPDGRAALRILLFGTILPLAAFFAYTRWLPLGGRDLSASYAWPRLLLQVTALAALVIGLTALNTPFRTGIQCSRL